MSKHNNPTSLLSRAFNLSTNNIKRNKFLSIATISVMAIIIFIFNIILAINFAGQTIINKATETVDLVIYLNDDVDIFTGTTMVAEIEKLPNVQSATYRSKEEALELMRKKSPELVESLQRNNLGNPLPPDIKIVTKSLSEHRNIIDFIQQRYGDKLHPLFNNLLTEKNQNLLSIAEENQKAQAITSEKVAAFTKDTKQILFWTILIFIIGGILILMNAIQITIFNRQKEIEIMKLVGATHSFIRLPYIFEGIIYAASATVISIILTLLLSSQLQVAALQSLTTIQYITIFGYELIVTIALGIASSYITVKQYLSR